MAVEVGTGAALGVGAVAAVAVDVGTTSLDKVGDADNWEIGFREASRDEVDRRKQEVQAATNKMMACHIAPVQFFRKKGSPIPGPFTGPYQTETALPTARIELRLDPQNS